MDKESPVISWIKNRILLIFSRFKKNAEAGIGEDKEQLIDLEEKSGEKKEEVPTSISEVLRKWLEFDEKIEKFDEMVEKDRKEILKDRKDISNKIIAGISGLEDEYDKRLKDLKASIIEELKKKKEEETVSDFITSKEDLEKIRDLAETVKSKKNLEKIMNIKIPIEVWKEEIEKIAKIAGMKLSNISPEALEEIKNAPLENIEMIYDMRLMSETVLKKLWLITKARGLVVEGEGEIPKPDEVQLDAFLSNKYEFISNQKKINNQLLFSKGVKSYKKRDFLSAYNYFGEIAKNTDLKEAWLNRGVAAGKLGKIDEQITSYERANRDKNYEKAKRYKNIAGRKKWIKEKWKRILKWM